MLGFKDIIRHYVEKTEKKITQKSKNKTNLIQLIKVNNIDIEKFE